MKKFMRTCLRSRPGGFHVASGDGIRLTPMAVRGQPASCAYHQQNKSDFSLGRLNLVTPLHIQVEEHVPQIAIIDHNGSHHYGDLIHSSNKLADKLSNLLGGNYEDVKGKRVAFLSENDSSYVVAELATWKIGGICVPLCRTHPVSELQYFLEDSGTECIVTDCKHAGVVSDLADKLKIHHVVLEREDYVTEPKKRDSQNKMSIDRNVSREDWTFRLDRDREFVHRNLFRDQAALIIYTSGTTGRPKGVLHTHGSLAAQVWGQVEAWQWRPRDTVLHVLPLHHVHGIVNTLNVPLYVGAACHMLPKFDAGEVWSRLVDPPTPGNPAVSLFMAVPTIYAKLIQYLEQKRQTPQIREFIRESCINKIRLMVSGSAALPEPIMTRWRELTGHSLLERYGMTELGMVLTNPLHGTRVPGAVGHPFPGVDVRITEPDSSSPGGYRVLAEGNQHRTRLAEGAVEVEGDLQTQGLNTFTEYWNRPEATTDTFTSDGWFKTGDRACFKDGGYRMLGRTSVDIIKSGGYKISALNIEHHLLAHPGISEISVVGLPDITWGQKVAAVVVLKDSQKMDLKTIRDWGARLLPYYQLPSVVKVVDQIPKNAMGKVNKKELIGELFAKELKMIR